MKSAEDKEIGELKWEETPSDIERGGRTATSSSASLERESRLSATWLKLVLNILGLGLMAIIILFVQATNWAEWSSDRRLRLTALLKTDVGVTLGILRAAQGLLSASTAIALSDALMFVQWNLMNSPGGLSYLSLLALSPTTGNIGTIALVLSGGSGVPPKLWALLRVGLTVVVWLSGLVLFFQTSLVTVYDTINTYPVAAGIGPFNASLIPSFMEDLQHQVPGYPYAVLPYTYSASAYTLVIDPLVSTISTPVKCPSGRCNSYLMTGGLEMLTPWAPEGYDDYPMIKVEKTPSMQLDFSGPIDDVFLDSDCDVFGQDGVKVGIRLCLAETLATATRPSSIIAGLFVCTEGTEGGICRTTDPPPNITTAVSFYTRTATVISSRANYTIMAVSDVSEPTPYTATPLPAYRSALRWLLNYTAAGVPAPSSIAQSFWSSPHQLAHQSTHGILTQNFQSVLAFPTWIFNINNWGNVALRDSNRLPPGLPPQYYTMASIVAPYAKMRFDPGMFVLFLVLQGAAMAFVWAVLGWVWLGNRDMPRTSSYPLFDVAFKARVDGGTRKGEVLNADSVGVVKLMKDAKALVKLE